MGELGNQRQEYVAQHDLGKAWPAMEHVKGSVFHHRDTVCQCVMLLYSQSQEDGASLDVHQQEMKWKSACIYDCVHICVSVCVYVSVCICVHKCLCICLYVCLCVYMAVYLCVSVFVSISVCLCLCM